MARSLNVFRGKMRDSARFRPEMCAFKNTVKYNRTTGINRKRRETPVSREPALLE
jgi:hypothetical protein